LAGNKMNQDADTINGELTQDVYSASFTKTSSSTFNFYNTTVAAIKDLTKTVSYITINQDITISVPEKVRKGDKIYVLKKRN